MTATTHKRAPRLGVLGGMGPLATAIFYSRIVERSTPHATKDQDHIDTVIFSDCAIPDRTTIIASGDKEPLLARAEEDFKILAYAGADAICFPCNTMHYFYDDLAKRTDVPLLNMIDIALGQLKKERPETTKIQIFGTDGTKKAGVYDRYAPGHGFEIVPTSDQVQAEVMGMIYKLKETGVPDNARLNELIAEAADQGIDAVILACTELSCMEVEERNAGVAFDAMDGLIDYCVAHFMPNNS